MTKVLIIDTETNGLSGAPSDVVLEVGVAELDTEDPTPGGVKAVYSQIVHHDRAGEWADSWIFKNTDLDPADVLASEVDEARASIILREIVRGRAVTSYNLAFDFGKFLDRRPWYLARSYAGKAPDIAELATSRTRALFEAGGIGDGTTVRQLAEYWADHPARHITAQLAYKVLCPGDPADLGGPQQHRALSDAVAEAHIMRAVIHSDEAAKRQVREALGRLGL